MRRAITSLFNIFLSFITALLFACSALAHNESTRLYGCDSNAGDQFGVSVAIDGNTAVVAGYNGDSNVVDSGTACVFEFLGSQWVQSQKLFASDASSGDKFGRSVAIQDDTIVIGSHFDDNNYTDAGSAYVFKRSGYVWSQQQKLIAPDAAPNDKFGYAVSIDGNTIAVGACWRQNNTGAVYVFTQNASTWSFQQQLTASDAAASDYFGCSVAVEANTILIGAYHKDRPGFIEAGGAYIFTRDGLVWSQQSILYASDPNIRDYFGCSVALDGNLAVIGAYECIINGIPAAGAAYVFNQTGSTWTQKQKLFDFNSPGSGYDFGRSVAIENNVIFAGSPLKAVDGNQVGAVFEFIKNDLNWIPNGMLAARESQANDNFGCSVAVSGPLLIIGAQFSNINGPSSGCAYVFDNTVTAGNLGDFDGDSDVDFLDFSSLAYSWLQNDPLRDIAPPFGDSIVNIGDLALFCDNWLAGK